TTCAAGGGNKRDVQWVGLRQCFGRSSGALFFLKRPDGDAFIFARWRERAGRMTREAGLLVPHNRCISVESFCGKCQNFRQGFIQIAAGSERAGETVKGCGSFFAATLRL